MNKTNAKRSLPDRSCHSFYSALLHIAGCEYTGHTGLGHKRVSLKRPSSSTESYVNTGKDKTRVISFNNTVDQV